MAVWKKCSTPKILKNSLKVYHINVCSLIKNFDDLECLINSTNINYSISAISETRVLRNLETTKNINAKNYHMEYTPIESTAEWTMLYIASHLA